jgi:hypothetical protein
VTGGSGGIGGGAQCFGAGACSASDYCAHDGAACDGAGFCVPRPPTCPPGCPAPDYQPCGCNDQLYCNECVAHLDGVSLSGQTGVCSGTGGAGGAGGGGQCSPASSPSACADCCYQTFPGGDVSLVNWDCACSPNAACATYCNPSRICAGGSVDTDACAACFASTLAPGGACAEDPTFQQQCLSADVCGGLAGCLAGCS